MIYTNKYINLISLIITIIIFLILNILFIKTPNISEKNMSNIIPKINFNLKKEKINNKIKINISDEELEKWYIEIPKINIKYPIIDHTNEETMKVCITKFWGPQANEIGNYTIAGHNNKDGTMFGKTKYLQIGDRIKLTNLKNETVEYEIFKIYSIDPDDVSCVESVEAEMREITLITCTNGHKNRLITKARQIQ